jgi:hypothetical protein
VFKNNSRNRDLRNRQVRLYRKYTHIAKLLKYHLHILTKFIVYCTYKYINRVKKIGL